LRTAGGLADGGPIRLLAMKLLFGYAFDPLSVGFCHRRAVAPMAVPHEINNTFAERHRDLLPAEGEGGDMIRQSCPNAARSRPAWSSCIGMTMTGHCRGITSAANVAPGGTKR